MDVVQSILFFILGFLCAGFLALLVAPSIWRRAVVLTRRRIEGSLPLTQAEISAEKDQLRAGFAMEARRLEMTIAGLQQKAAGQAVDIGRLGEQFAAAQSEGVQKSEAIAALEGRLALHAWLIIILLAVATPVTTALLARAALFRRRAAVQQGGDRSVPGEAVPAQAGASVTKAKGTAAPPSS